MSIKGFGDRVFGYRDRGFGNHIMEEAFASVKLVKLAQIGIAQISKFVKLGISPLSQISMFVKHPNLARYIGDIS